MLPDNLVRNTVQESLGSFLAGDIGFTEGISSLLRRYSPTCEPLSSLSHRMEEYLFNSLYSLLGPGMTVRSDDGAPRRFYMSDLPTLADELLFPLFISWKPDPSHYILLHDFWMNSSSFSAMRALFLVYQDQLPKRELDLILRIVEENIPPVRRQAWLSFPNSRNMPLKG